jgi:ABC-type spermidine/putrescine transport system permease subunit II
MQDMNKKQADRRIAKRAKSLIQPPTTITFEIILSHQSRRRTGAHSGLVLLCVAAMCILAASLPMSGLVRQRWWLRKTFQALRRFTIICAGWSLCREPT